MLFSEQKKSLSEYIIEILNTTPLTGVEIVAEAKKRTDTSKESVYRVLRDLLGQEIINKAKKKYSLNRHWVQQMYSFFQKQIENPRRVDTEQVLTFSEGDSITYQFKNPDLMGIYWGHLYDYVVDTHPKDIPIVIYHPHEWLIYARKKSEKYFLERFEKDKKLVLFSIGGNTPLDKKFKTDWTNTYRKINTNVLISGLKKNRYINVLGDFIFEIRTSVAFEESVNSFFEKNKIINKEKELELEQIVKKQSHVKLIFSKNKKRAEELRKKLSKDFYIPKS